MAKSIYNRNSQKAIFESTVRSNEFMVSKLGDEEAENAKNIANQIIIEDEELN